MEIESQTKINCVPFEEIALNSIDTFLMDITTFFVVVVKVNFRKTKSDGKRFFAI